MNKILFTILLGFLLENVFSLNVGALITGLGILERDDIVKEGKFNLEETPCLDQSQWLRRLLPEYQGVLLVYGALTGRRYHAL